MQYMILILMLFSDPSKYLNDAVVVEKNGNEFYILKQKKNVMDILVKIYTY